MEASSVAPRSDDDAEDDGSTPTVDSATLKEAIKSLLEKERRVALLEARANRVASNSSFSSSAAANTRDRVKSDAAPPLPASSSSSSFPQDEAAAYTMRTGASTALMVNLGRSPSAGTVPPAAGANNVSLRFSWEPSTTLRAPCTTDLIAAEDTTPPTSGIIFCSHLPLNSTQIDTLRSVPPTRVGLSLSRAGLTDDSVPIPAHALIQSLTTDLQRPGTESSYAEIKILDFSWNDLGPRSAAALHELVRRLPGLEALHTVGSAFGGPSGASSMLFAASNMPTLRHFGLSLQSVGVLPVASAQTPVPAAASARSPSAPRRGGGRRPVIASRGARGRGRSAQPVTPKPSAALAAGAGLDILAGCGAEQQGLTASDAGTVWHLAAALRSGAIRARSISVAGSSFTRQALAVLMASCGAPLTPPIGVVAPPPSGPLSASRPKTAAAAPVSMRGGRGGLSTATAAAAGRGRAAPPAAPPPAPSTSGSSSTLPSPLPADPAAAVSALDLSRSVLAAQSVLDLALALKQQQTPPAAAAPAAASAGSSGGGGRGGAAAVASNSLSFEAAAHVAAIAAGSPRSEGGAPAASLPPRLVPLLRLPGALHCLRSLDLTQCSLSSHALKPLVQALAAHVRHLRVLVLRGNHIDDAGAGMLAEAVAANAARLLLPPPPSDGAVAGSSAAGAGSPLCVLDVRNNPLFYCGSEQAQDHPGCHALLRVLQSTPSLLTVTGPGPTVEVLHRHAAAAHAAVPAGGGGGNEDAPSAFYRVFESATVASGESPSGACCGWGQQWLVNLHAVRQSALRVLRGDIAPPCSGGDSSSLNSAGRTGLAAAALPADASASLDMPHRLAHACAATTLKKVEALAPPDGLGLVCLASCGSLPLQVCLLLPSSRSSSHAVATPKEIMAATARCFAAARMARSIDVAALGVPIVVVPVPPAASVASSGSEGRRFLEWHSTFTAIVPAGAAATARECSLVWSVLYCAGRGVGGSAATACDGSAFCTSTARLLCARSHHGTGSMDRIHARVRSSTAAGDATSLALTGKPILSAINDGSAVAEDGLWLLHSAGLQRPSSSVALQQRGGDESTEAGSARTCLLSWDPAWQSVQLPPSAAVDGGRLVLIAKLVQADGPRETAVVDASVRLAFAGIVGHGEPPFDSDFGLNSFEL